MAREHTSHNENLTLVASHHVASPVTKFSMSRQGPDPAHDSEVKHIQVVVVPLSFNRPSIDDPIAVLQTGNEQSDALSAQVCTDHPFTAQACLHL